MLGNPSSVVPVVVSGADVVYVYDPSSGGYEETTTLQPRQGAFVYSATSNQVTLTPDTGKSGSPASTLRGQE